jgi:hypothetical protein
MDNLFLLNNSYTVLEGWVADNYDPEDWGRVRVHIKGRTEGITDTDKLPFARVLHPLSSTLNRTDDPPELGTSVLMFMPNTKDYNSLIILGCFKNKNQTVQ